MDPTLGPYQNEHDTARQTIGVLVAAQIVLLPIAMLLYPDGFSLTRDPLSALGARFALSGVRNLPSNIAFAVDLVSSGVLLLAYANRHNEPTTGDRLRRALGIIGGIGAMVAIAPHDTMRAAHSLGTGMFIGSLWGICSVDCWDRRRESPGVSVLTQLVLQSTVIPYAIVYSLACESKQVWQKLAVSGLMVGLMLITRSDRAHRTAARYG